MRAFTNHIKKIFPGVVISTILALLLNGCVKNKIDDIVSDSVFGPTYSIPVGTADFSMKDVTNEYSDSLFLIADTLSYLDSLDLFNYDSAYYRNLQSFDFVSEKDLDIASLTDKTDYIKMLMIRTNYINGIPGRILMQVYFLNSSRIVMDSVFKNGWFTVEPAPADNIGYVTGKFKSEPIDTYLDSTIINLLPEIKAVRIFTRLETENFNITKIKYLGDQDFWLQLGLRVEFEIPLDEITQ